MDPDFFCKEAKSLVRLSCGNIDMFGPREVVLNCDP